MYDEFLRYYSAAKDKKNIRGYIRSLKFMVRCIFCTNSVTILQRFRGLVNEFLKERMLRLV